MTDRKFSIIIPTYNNPQYLDPCIRSINDTGMLTPIGLGEIIIVNNGKQPIKQQYSGWKNVKVIDSPENVGWEGGLKLGLEASETSYVCFQNDDTFIPHGSFQFYQRLLYLFQNKNVAAVGPATTVAAGLQSIYHPGHPFVPIDVRWLIFFTVMVRRSALDEVGGIDTSLPGGDDFDLSIRLRKAGYRVLMNPETFIVHHGFKTGNRVHGDHTVDGGWNSQKMSDRTNQALIRKHGFKEFFSTISSQMVEGSDERDIENREGKLVASLVKETESVLELGCGLTKTVPWAIGVDRVANGEESKVDTMSQGPCVADIQADVTGDIPTGEHDVIVARHILEHIVDAVGAVKNWMRYLKPGGRLILALPDQRHVNSIVLNPEHVHAFTPQSLKTFVEACGLKHVTSYDVCNGHSFVGVYQKAPKVVTTFSNSQYVTVDAMNGGSNA